MRALVSPLVLCVAVGCGTEDKEAYDLAAWQSPLASQFGGTADAVEGERIYMEEQWSDGSPYAFRCISCHSVDAADTLLEDADQYNRPAHTTWNAAYRETWKGSHTWDQAESDRLGAFGGQICITAYFPEGDVMSPEQAAHLEAWMKTNIDGSAGAATSQQLNYDFNDWPGQDAFLDSVSDGAGGWLYGADLGDPDAGEVLLNAHCGSCHTPDGEAAPVIYSGSTAPLDQLISRIRKVEIESPAPNDRMPRITVDRLDDGELADLLAFLTLDHGAG